MERPNLIQATRGSGAFNKYVAFLCVNRELSKELNKSSEEIALFFKQPQENLRKGVRNQGAVEMLQMP